MIGPVGKFAISSCVGTRNNVLCDVQMMTFGTSEELCRASQFVEHLIHRHVKIVSPTARLGNCVPYHA